jgi:hypothetical protein
MIFDELWRAERKAREKAKRIRETYQPRLETAKKKGAGADEYQAVLAEYYFEQDLNDEPERIRTERIIRKARKLGIPIPPKPAYDSAEMEENESWRFNWATGNAVFTEKAEFVLVREIRKEEVERVQHQMRWVNHVVIPIIGLIGTFMGLIALLHSLGIIG